MIRGTALLLLVLTLSQLTGCQSSFARYYVPQSLEKSYAPVPQVKVQRIGTQDLNEVRQRLYANAAIVGSAKFIGLDESDDALEKFAGKLGADVVLWRQTFVSEAARTDYRIYPRTDTSTATTKVDGKTVKQNVNTTRDEYVPYTSSEVRYEHEAMFLRVSK